LGENTIDREKVIDAITEYLTGEAIVIGRYEADDEIVVDGVIMLDDLADAILKRLERVDE
jgi:hypothetical protein